MNSWHTFHNLVSRDSSPVILLEGRRSIPAADAVLAVRLGRFLASEFPYARFRSGNAEGSDAAFSEGVALADPTRLEVVVPYATHRKKARVDGAAYVSPQEVDRLCEPELLQETMNATPANKNLIAQYGRSGPAASKAAYLVRDTLKVLGIDGRLSKPVAALFWVDLSDLEAGGTGHTIRVCRQQNVPVFFQDEWMQWLPPLEPVNYRKIQR